MVKLSRRDERMVSKRARSEPLSEPPYDLELVPNVDDASLIDGSVLVMQTDRDAWKAALTELLLLCNEAAWRSSKRHDAGARGLPLPAAPAEAKPLVLEYILDRLDTDDPLNGYQLRTRAEGWLQGFVTFTTFTTWQTYFRWDSLDPRAGITLDDCDAHVVDESGELAAALDECGRVGDPDRCGVVWPRVAEITLLGGLGCGAQLLQLALDHLASLNTYDFVVLQATDNAVPFYERHGFTRVGAVAAHHALPPAETDGADGKASAPPPPKRPKPPTPKSAAAKSLPQLSDSEALALARAAVATLRPPERAPAERSAAAAALRRVEGARLWWANRALHAFVKALASRPCAMHFLDPVADALAYYRELVAEPMDLASMAGGACAGVYEGRLAAVVADARRIESAALAYHGKRSKDALPREVCAHAARLVKDADALARAWQLAMPSWLFGAESLPPPAAAAAGPPAELLALPSAREGGAWPTTFAQPVGAALAAEAARAPASAPSFFAPSAPAPAPASRVAPRDAEYVAAAAADPGILGYSHWTFADQPTLDQFPSYMMAARLAPLGAGAKLPPAAAAPRGAARARDPSTALRERLNARARGAVPRGAKFVAKLLGPAGGSPEYYGPCETEAEASALYEHGASELRAREAKAATKRAAAAAAAAAAEPVRSPAVAAAGAAVHRLLGAVLSPSAGAAAPAARRPRTRLWEVRARLLVENEPRPRAQRAACARGAAELKPERDAADAAAAGAKRPAASPAAAEPVRSHRLYNAVVTVAGLPEAYARHHYWFVMQYVPDMQWCHLVPLRSYGRFPARNALRQQRPIWKLAPEGQVRELDVPASRCIAVKASLVARTPDADKEVWDIFDSEPFANDDELD